MDEPLVAKIHKGKKTTYIDEAIKRKAFVPGSSRYNVTADILPKGGSSMAKGKRKLMTDDIANFHRLNRFPGPNHFKPDPKPTQRKYGTSYN